MKKKFAVVPDPGPDPIADARAHHANCTAALSDAIERLTAVRKVDLQAQDDFDHARIDVVEKSRSSEVLKSAERIATAADADEKNARKALDELVTKKLEKEYRAAIARHQDWLAKAHPLIQQIAAWHATGAKLVDEILDVVAEAQVDFDEALRLEREVAPMFPMAASGIRRVELKDARFMVRVAIARAMEGAGYDVPGTWFDGEPKPKFGQPGLAEFERAVKLLEGDTK